MSETEKALVDLARFAESQRVSNNNLWHPIIKRACQVAKKVEERNDRTIS